MAKDVKIQIVGDASKYKAALADAGSSSDKFSKQTKDNGESMSKFGIGALAVGGAIGVGLFKAGEAASNLGESVNAVKVTFGKSADGILKLGENAATAVGLSNTAFNGLAVQFSSFATTIAGKGGDVVGTMSDMTGRAADFASVMNIDVAEAAAMFQSGLAGETEPLKKFGLDLSAAAVEAYAAANGIGEVGKQLTESEKVTARYGLLMQSTAKTQGDFANTSDSAANATRIAKAEFENAAASLGAVVAPVMATVATKAADLAKGFVDINEATGGALLQIVAFAGGGLVLVGTIASIVGKIKMMNAALNDTAIGNMMKKAIGPTALLGVALVGLSLRAGHAAQEIKKIGEAADELSTVADKDVFNTLFKGIAAGIVAGISLEDVMKKLAQTNLEGAKRALESAEAHGADQRVIVALTDAIKEEERAASQATTTTEEFAAAGDETAVAFDGAAVATALMEAATEAATKAVEKHERASKSLRDQVDRDLAAIQTDWDELTGTIDDDQVWTNLQLDFIELKTKIEEAWKAGAEGADNARELALEARAAIDGQKKSVIEYAKEVLGLPKESVTRILASIDAGQLDLAEAQLANLTRNRNANIQIVTRGGAGYDTDNNPATPFAEGGIVKARPGGMLARIGEGRRDEAVVPLNSDGSIPGSGGGNVFNITVAAGVDGYKAGQQIVAALAEYERRSGDDWRRVGR